MATPQSLDHVVAIVNNGVILQTDIDTAMKTVKANAGEKGQPLPPADVLKEQVLEKLVLDESNYKKQNEWGFKLMTNV